MILCEDCGDECKRRTRCKKCKKMIWSVVSVQPGDGFRTVGNVAYYITLE